MQQTMQTLLNVKNIWVEIPVTERLPTTSETVFVLTKAIWQGEYIVKRRKACYVNGEWDTYELTLEYEEGEVITHWLEPQTVIEGDMVGDIFKDWGDTSLKLFPLATWQGSLIHAKEELDEIIDEPDDAKAVIEYADVVMCVITSIYQHGFTLEQIAQGLKEKAEINKGRTWRFIEDGKYYKHIKK